MQVHSVTYQGDHAIVVGVENGRRVEFSMPTHGGGECHGVTLTQRPAGRFVTVDQGQPIARREYKE